MNFLSIKKICFIACCFSTILSTSVVAQNPAWMEYVEELSDSEIGSAYIENLFDELSYLSENPFDLNTVTKSDWERLPFLSELQIENLLYYVYKYAPVQSIYELRNVEGMDMQTINLLLPFVYAGEVKPNEQLNPKQVIRYGKHEMLLRFDYCFQEKAGYHTPTEEELTKNSNKHYLGENYYLSARYGFSYKNKIQLGMVGEKDAGEAFWNNQHKGFDFYSIHFAIKDIGIVKNLLLGDYRASFGQGLVLNTDFTMGKTSDVININKKNAGIKRHFSTNEIDYLRGAALTLSINNCTVDILYSHKQTDATVTDTEIISFKTDGYNRTHKDLEKKNQAELNLYGANFQWKTADFNIGASAVYYDFGGKALSPTPQPYNLFYLRDKNNYNIGVNYGFHRKFLFFRGETAMSKNNAYATINTLQFNPVSSIAFVASYRDYRKNYQSHYGRAFAESSTIQNESGFYFGTDIKLKKHWKLAAYIDAFKFPWLKYGVNMPSEGSDFLLQISYRPRNDLDMNFRYKDKIKEKNYTPDQAKMASVLSYEQKKIRYQLNYNNSTGFKSRLQLDYTLYTETNNQDSEGWMIAQSAGYQHPRFPIQIDGGFSYFKTDDWNSRVYAYEKNILYAFSFPAFSGEGFRTYSVLKINILKNMTAYMKIAWTHHFDRNEISSNLEKIEGKNKTDANLLLKIKF